MSGALWPVSLLLGLCVLTFFLTYVAPGDPARIVLGPTATEQNVNALRAEMGLNRSVMVQFGQFLREAVTGRWGVSWLTRQPVLQEISSHLRPTISLGFLASIYSITTALVLNVLAFVFPRLGHLLIPLVRLGIAVPGFVVSVAAALGMISLQSVTGARAGDGILSYAVPALAVALYPTCVMTALLRDRIADIIGSSFYRAGRASGYSLDGLFLRVLLPNSWSALFTAWVNQISVLVFSTIVVEYVFSFRGIGALLIRSIQGKDLPVISGIILLNGLFFLFVHTLSNVRIRSGAFESSKCEVKPEGIPAP